MRTLTLVFLVAGLGLSAAATLLDPRGATDLSRRAYHYYECNWNGRRCTTCIPKGIGHSMYCTKTKILCDCDKVELPPNDCVAFDADCGELMSCTDPTCNLCSPAGQPCFLPSCTGNGNPCPP